MRRLSMAAVCACVAVVASCGWDKVDHGSTTPDSGLPDAGDAPIDAGVDSGQPEADAGVDSGQPEADAGLDGGGPVDGGGGTIRVYARGDLTPTPLPSWPSQTPTAQEFGIARLELLRSASDPSPVLAFDSSSAPVMVDMVSGASTLAGTVRTADVPAGTYTHGRVLMSLVRTTVDAMAHANSLALAGKLTVTSALSNTTYQNQSWPKGRTEYGFAAAGYNFTVPGALPALPSTAGGAVVEEPGKTWLVFPFSAPFQVNPSDTQERSTTIVYAVYRSFQWQDLTTTGFTADVFDLDASAQSAEPVVSFGATGYRTTVP